MSSLLQGPVQAEDGQSMTLTDFVQQWTNPVSIGGSDQPQFNTEPSFSSPQTQNLLSELVRDLASPKPAAWNRQHGCPESILGTIQTAHRLLSILLSHLFLLLASVHSTALVLFLTNTTSVSTDIIIQFY